LSREKLALNHALMIEMIRSKEVADLEIIELLKNADSKEFTPYGEGIPDWQTFIDFYRNHSEKVKNAIILKCYIKIL